MEKKGFGPRREAGKNPVTGRSAGRSERPTGRPTGKGKGFAQGGVDLRALDQLAEAGMLSSEGKRLKAQMMGADAPEGPKRFTRRDAGGEGARGALRPRRDEGREGSRDGAGPRARREATDGDAGRPKLRRATVPVAFRANLGPQGPERLHKVMAQTGLASRRHSEELIQAGRVTVNGQVVTQLGTKVTPGKDLIEIDGRPLGKAEEPIHLLLNKPKGYVTTLFDPQGRKKVTDLLGGEVGQRVYPVGRLDYDTEGLLLLTNDGDLANALMHPSQQIKKTYIAKVRGVPNPSKITQLEQGVELEDGITAPADVKLLEAHGPNAASLSIRIHEGRNRQVRRMFEAIGHEVISLRRTTLGPLHLKNLKVGEWRYLTPQELMDLRSAVGDKTAARAAFIAEKSARRGKGRFDVEAAGAPETGAETGPRLRPIVRGTTPVTEGTKPVIGRPARLTRGQEYGTKPFTRPSREDRPTRFDPAGAAPLGLPTRGDGPKQFGRPNREDSPKQFGRPNREDGPRQFGRPNREDGPRQFGRPNREDGPKQFGRPNREDGPKQFGRPSREDAPKQFGRPNREDGPRQFGRPNREDGPKQFGRPNREDGPRQFGRPNREDGPKQFGRPEREGGGKSYARPTREFYPRERNDGPTGPRRRP